MMGSGSRLTFYARELAGKMAKAEKLLCKMPRRSGDCKANFERLLTAGGCSAASRGRGKEEKPRLRSDPRRTSLTKAKDERRVTFNDDREMDTLQGCQFGRLNTSRGAEGHVPWCVR